ncbi:MAG TPA: radical SAM family heme chaperone HemW [Polyangiaceae bacterium]|nr:radical SAM family heme chaperone HemW [Polyangiaceae bacterium]
MTSETFAAVPTETLGVYVHFPWCLKKCPYCDFLSLPAARDEIPHARYADAVIAELAARRASLPDLPLRSIFFGGGTPSLWKADELGRVLARILEAFPVHGPNLEITAECNPSSFDDTVATGLARAGVNRISLGVQSLDRERLAFLGRLHDAAGALEALDVATHHPFQRVSADLIFGVAGESPEAAKQEVETLVERGITHLSAYALTIEPGTQFGELARRNRLPLLSDDAVADSFAAVEGALEARGFVHYEVSNYAKPGAEAQHNLGYWRGEPYVGIGAGAWGTLPIRDARLRYRNTPSAERYLGWAREPSGVDLEREGEFVAVTELLDGETAFRERLMLGLRLAEGFDWRGSEARTGATMWTAARRRAFEKWSRRGALEERDGRLHIERRHWLLADGIIADLM